MDEKNKLSSKVKSSDKWLNLILAVLVPLFLIYLGMPLVNGDWTQATDYYAFYNAGKIINEGDFTDVYNLAVLEGMERNLLMDIDGQIDENFEVNPVQYPPLFLWPFSLFAMTTFPVSLMIWLSINFLGLFAYLRFFAEKVCKKTIPLQVLLLLLFSFPVLINLHYGQVNVWLLICIGEFLRASLSNKPWRAGLWLGGLLIKPHLLILLLPFLLIQKRYREIAGFIISSFVVMGLSFVLVGVDGFVALKDVMLEAAQGGVSSGYQYMMNWRMVSHYVEIFSSPVFGNVVLIALTVITAALPMIMFRKRIIVDSPMFAVAVLGVLAATTAVTYHIHIHTAMILIPLLLYLFMRGLINQRLFLLWIVIPYFGFFLLYLVGLLILGNILPISFGIIIEIGFGSGMLIANLLLLLWTIRRSHDETRHSTKVKVV